MQSNAQKDQALEIAAQTSSVPRALNESSNNKVREEKTFG